MKEEFLPLGLQIRTQRPRGDGDLFKVIELECGSGFAGQFPWQQQRAEGGKGSVGLGRLAG